MNCLTLLQEHSRSSVRRHLPFQVMSILALTWLALPLRAAPEIYILGDMEKPNGSQEVASSPSFLVDGAVTLHGAGNEVVAFQAVLRAKEREEGLEVRISDLEGPSKLAYGRQVQAYLAHYIGSLDASYSWGPGSGGVLPWRAEMWPDALIPMRDPYSPAGEPVVGPVSINPIVYKNQAFWFDIFIPADAPAGLYQGKLDVLQKGTSIKSFPVRLTVHPFALPNETHVDAFGELYRENGVMFDSGVKFKLDPARDWAVYKRYLQMAHAHRMLAVHRAENGPIPKTARAASRTRSTSDGEPTGASTRRM